MTTNAAVPLNRRVKDRMRDEVAQTAIGLFLDKGFEATTVDEICAVAGMSRRTFFRYFDGKEDVVGSVFRRLAEEGCAAFVDRPPDEDVWTALRHCMDPFVTWSEADERGAMEMLRLVEETPSLQANYHARIDRWRGSLAEVISQRLGLGAEHDVYVAVIAAASVGAFVAGARAWLASGGEPGLASHFDRGFTAVSPNPA